MYHISEDGTWHFCEFTKGGYLKSGPSPWLDDEGKPEHEYAWRSAYVDRDNNRYGEIRDLIDTQDQINKLASKIQHLGSVRQTYATETALGDMSTLEMRKQLAKPQGHIELAPGAEFGKDFGIIPTNDQAQVMQELLMLNMADMQEQGANASMQGNGSKDASGRAILANQAGGALAVSPLFDTAKSMDHEAYRKIWRRIRQFWKAEEWVRVTDDDNSIRWVGLNTPEMAPAVDPMTGQPMMGPNGPVMQPVMDPMTGQPKLRNQIAQLDIDIEIDDAPHVGTMQQEEFQNLVELAKTGFPIKPKTLLKASSFRSKADMIKDVDEQEKAAANQPNPEQAKVEAQLKLEQAKAQGQLQIKQAELQMRQQEKAAELQMEQERQAVELQVEMRKQEMQLAFEARKHAQEMAFAREKHQLDQAARAQAARDAHTASQRQESRAH
jgi:hypothetical protein